METLCDNCSCHSPVRPYLIWMVRRSFLYHLLSPPIFLLSLIINPHSTFFTPALIFLLYYTFYIMNTINTIKAHCISFTTYIFIGYETCCLESIDCPTSPSRLIFYSQSLRKGSFRVKPKTPQQEIALDRTLKIFHPTRCFI